MRKPKTSLRKVNDLLYKALNELWNQHIENGGTLKYREKERVYISDTLDLIEIGYYKRKPDGDRQTELYKMFKERKNYLNDLDAYEELISRFDNTTP